ncbi:MAG: DUF4173 domain-containing protein [Winogradskyella sp.]|nr:DUF4173 domain-containing protein [Winogradskyella sp.]
MKKLILFTAALLFSTLFYDKSIGINLFLFSVLSVVILAINNSDDFKNKKNILYTCIYLATGLAVFFHDSALAIIANTISFFTLIGVLSQSKASIYVAWLNGLYTTIAGFFHRNFTVDETTQKVESNKEIDYVHLTKIIVIPGTIVIIFIGLYQNGNPIFNNLIEKIDFSFINIQWLLFAGLGYYLFSNIHKPIEVEPATSQDLKTGNLLFKTKDFSIPKLKQENQLGIILIALLNVLIVIFLITDITFILTNLDIRASVFSTQVHSGINALIASIVIAIIILLYVFRGNLNFYKENKTLKNLALAWILLNVILVLSIAVKNGQYIYYFGLTYKRIGVLVYLTLTLIGLITTLIKINKTKNIWYLFRLNTKAAFVVLVVAAMINWDYHITNYNFKYAKSMDINYLIDLSDNNTFLLKEETKTRTLDKNSRERIQKKYEKYCMELYNNEWQELQYDSFKLKLK